MPILTNLGNESFVVPYWLIILIMSFILDIIHIIKNGESHTIRVIKEMVDIFRGFIKEVTEGKGEEKYCGMLLTIVFCTVSLVLIYGFFDVIHGHNLKSLLNILLLCFCAIPGAMLMHYINHHFIATNRRL